MGNKITAATADKVARGAKFAEANKWMPWRVMYHYLTDIRVGWVQKVLLVLSVVYLVIPTDLIADVTVIGMLDDLGILGFVAMLVLKAAYRYEAGRQLEMESGTSREPRAIETTNATIREVEAPRPLVLTDDGRLELPDPADLFAPDGTRKAGR